MERFTTEKFIADARRAHGDKYDYSKVEYKNSATKVTIICRKHGVFEQIPASHLRGRGCPDCSGKKKLTKEDFIARARQKHSYKYDYTKVDYKDTHTKVVIGCPEHGEFEQIAFSHLGGRGCAKCAIERRKLTKLLNKNERQLKGP